MIPHTLTHNYYAIASLTTLTLGSSYICNQLHEQLLSKFNLSLMDTNAIIKLIFTIFGFTIVPWQLIFESNYSIEIEGLIIGTIIGLAYVEIETLILKQFPIQTPNKITFYLARNNSIRSRLTNRENTTSQNQLPSYISTIFTGAYEEILYRGFITILCINLLSSTLSIFMLIITTLLFALSHLSLGYTHVFTKFILGIICLTSFLLTKTIVTPVFIHITFNAMAINKLRVVIND